MSAVTESLFTIVKKSRNPELSARAAVDALDKTRGEWSSAPVADLLALARKAQHGSATGDVASSRSSIAIAAVSVALEALGKDKTMGAREKATAYGDCGLILGFSSPRLREDMHGAAYAIAVVLEAGDVALTNADRIGLAGSLVRLAHRLDRPANDGTGLQIAQELFVREALAAKFDPEAKAKLRAIVTAFGDPRNMPEGCFLAASAKAVLREIDPPSRSFLKQMASGIRHKAAPTPAEQSVRVALDFVSINPPTAYQLAGLGRLQREPGMAARPV